MARITTIVITLHLLLSSIAHATPYAGLGLGSDTIDFDQSAHVYQGNSFDVVQKTHLSGTGVYGTFFAGYDYVVNKLYLGGEANANLSTSAFKATNSEYVHANFSVLHYKINNSFGLSFLPGYQFTSSSLFYGRLGYSTGRFKIRSSDASIANESTRRNGFRYGLGLKQVINERSALRVDYSRINYNHVVLHTLDSLSSTIKNTSIRPQQQLVELGLIVNF